MVLFGIDLWQSCGSTMIKLRKKYKELNLLGKKKQYKTMTIHAHFLFKKSKNSV